jgi:Sec-independent protein translocase protein TatA
MRTGKATMNFAGIGLEEILFILLLALVIFSPADMRRLARTLGRGLSRLSRSETWRLLRQAGEELRGLPQRWMREVEGEVWREAAHGESQEKTPGASASPAGRESAPTPAESEVSGRKPRP